MKITPFVSLLTACLLLLTACQKNDNLQRFTIDESASAMEWKGYLKDGSGNNGTIQIKGELLGAETGEIIGGQIRLPLGSLININLPTDELKNQLIHHLQSADFFDMAVYPEIGFRLTSLTPDTLLPGTYQTTGELTMLGKSRPVSFPVKQNLRGNRLEVTGETSIDRTQWGITYASDETAPNGQYIKPGMDVEFKLVALKQDR
ncbi:YceI family protein [Larkinella sp. GY13]|uniref:YceI family protein n=1 Tax=Larkinella sp. GY13 TaxID=3453720 RepID=UPI003EEB6B1D